MERANFIGCDETGQGSTEGDLANEVCRCRNSGTVVQGSKDERPCVLIKIKF